MPKQDLRAGAKIMNEAYNYQEIIALTYTLIEEIEKLRGEAAAKHEECLEKERFCQMLNYNGAMRAYLRSKSLVKTFLNVLELRKS